MNPLVREAILNCDPFAKPKDVLKVECLNEWDILITFKDGRKMLYDGFTKYHRVIHYNNVNELTDEQEKKEFSYMLRNIMARKYITQEELAKRINTSQVMISRYTSGKTLPSVLMVRKIAKALNCSIDDFFPKTY